MSEKCSHMVNEPPQYRPGSIEKTDPMNLVENETI